MHYQYRWVYSILIFIAILMFGHGYLIAPERTKLSELIMQETTLKNEIFALKTPPKKANSTSQKTITVTNFLQQLMQIARKNQVQIIHFQPQMDKRKRSQIDLKLLGESAQLQQYFLQLLQFPSSFFVTHVAFQNIKGEAQLNLKLLFLTTELPMTMQPFKKISPIFCDANSSALPSMTMRSDREFSIHEMIPIGQLSDQHQALALLQLPNGASFIAHKNMLIGKERAKIIAIKDGKLVMQLPDHQVKVLAHA